eukprot:131211-Pyramimonas_sp.AAC.1
MTAGPCRLPLCNRALRSGRPICSYVHALRGGCLRGTSPRAPLSPIPCFFDLNDVDLDLVGDDALGDAHDVLDGGQRLALEVDGIGHGDVRARDALHGGVQ